MKTKDFAYRLTLCILGTAILALGLMLTAETGLGTSPLTAIPFVLAAYTGISFPDATLLFNCLLIIIEIIIKRERKYILPLLLQLPVSLLLTQVMRLVQSFIDISDFSLALRLMLLLLAMLLTGFGAALGLRMRLVPNAGDGFVHTLAEKLRKPLGDVKNAVDISCVLIGLVLSLVLMGRPVGFGLGSIIVMFGVGRVICLANRIYDILKIKKY